MVLAQGAVDADFPLQQLRNTTISCGVSSAVLFLQANGCEKSIESLLSDAPTCEELSIADVLDPFPSRPFSINSIDLTDAPSGLRASISEEKNILFSFDLAEESTDSSITSNCVINAILNVECDGRIEALSFPIDFVR